MDDLGGEHAQLHIAHDLLAYELNTRLRKGGVQKCLVSIGEGLADILVGVGNCNN